MLALLAAGAAFGARDAQAQVCFKFVAFCDGICIDDVTNHRITAHWYHFDCVNDVPMTGGSRREAPVSNACPGGDAAPGAVVRCEDCGGFGDWYFVVDAPLDGTLDMHSGVYPDGTCWVDELAYELMLGEPAGAGPAGAGPEQARGRSSVQ